MNIRHINVNRRESSVVVYLSGSVPELAANLRAYCVDYRILPGESGLATFLGIPYAGTLPDDRLEVFIDAIRRMVEILGVRGRLTAGDEKDFATALLVVQSCQADQAGRGAA
jgi:hypothetical protein